MISLHYIETIGNISEITLMRLASKLPNKVISNCPQYKKKRNRQDYIIGKLVLQYILKENGYSITLIDNISYQKIGKPFISEEVDFNISHSGNYVVCVFSTSLKVGVDIEKHKKINPANLYSLIRYNNWDIKTENCDSRTFFDYWTIQESVLKAKGIGLSGISNIKIDYHNNEAYLGNEKWYFKRIELLDGYSISVASNKFNSFIKIEKLNLSDLLI